MKRPGAEFYFPKPTYNTPSYKRLGEIRHPEQFQEPKCMVFELKPVDSEKLKK
jgi:hypothetical protein